MLPSNCAAPSIRLYHGFSRPCRLDSFRLAALTPIYTVRGESNIKIVLIKLIIRNHLRYLGEER